MSIEINIKNIQNRIKSACEKSQRDPGSVKIVAVTKTVSTEKIGEAIKAGITDIGENRVQEAWQKFQVIGNRVKWHLIGHLQTNKVNRALQFVDIIHSIDSLRLAEEIQQQAQKVKKKIDVLIQVNTSREASKFGIAPEETTDLVDKIAKLSNLNIKGLMTIGTFTSNKDEIRMCFRKLRNLRDSFTEQRFKGVYMDELSMGMTNDFEIAIEEGATLVRLGRLIFGER